MALIQRYFRKDKAKALNVRPVRKYGRKYSVQPVRSSGVSRANANHLTSNGVKILSIYKLRILGYLRLIIKFKEKN